MIDRDITKTVSFTGHRILPKDFDYEYLYRLIKNLCEVGYNTFLIGMAIGFDTACFHTLEKLKKEGYDVFIVACIPCLNQDKSFNNMQKQDYFNMINNSDYIEYVSDKEYNLDSMMNRNKFMVDNSCMLVAYVKHNFGGSYKTLKYALHKNKSVINF